MKDTAAARNEQNDRPPARRRPVVAWLLQISIIALVTVALGEVAARWILDIQPLSAGDAVWGHHPRWGWAHRPESQDTFVKLAANQVIRINSKGLRERELSYEKAPGTRRVLVIGDSNVVGFEVAQEDVWTRVAESFLRARGHDVELINGGTRGWGTDQSLLFLSEEGLKYDPDLVLYYWNDNDLDDNATIHRPFRRYGKGYFNLDSAGELELQGVPVPQFEYGESLLVDESGDVYELDVPFGVRLRLWVRDNIVSTSAFGVALVHVAAAVPQIGSRLGTAGSFAEPAASRGDQEPRITRVTAAMIREMERVSCRAGGSFLLFVEGDKSRWIGQTAGVGLFDPWDDFYASLPDDADVIVPFDTHLNELGHRLLGEAIGKALANEDPWQPSTACAAGFD